jgi:small subunit ribosomal protein S19
MAVRVFKFRGKTLEELQQMDTKELMPLLGTSARRKFKRGLTEEEKKFMKALEGDKRKFKTHCRTIVILPNMVGKTISIHNGKEYRDVIITAEMIGHRLGEYSLTRNRVSHNAPGIGATRSSAAMSVK